MRRAYEHLARIEGRDRSRRLPDLRDDSGVAMVIVVAIMVILFMLTSTLIALATLQSRNEASHEWRVKAMHMADAGLNAYLYQLRRDPTYYVSHPDMGPQSLEDGVWRVTTTAPTEDEPLTVRCTGFIPSREVTRTVVATVQFPTYAEYMFLSNADINIGSGATIEGKIRTNGSISNAGTVTGKAYAHGTIGGSGTFEQGYEANQPIVNFASVSADMAAMKTKAQSSGFYFDGSGGKGYKVVLINGQISVDRVTGGLETGNLTTEHIGTYAIPADGIVYFGDGPSNNEDVWVSGDYSVMVTIAADRDIYVPDDLEPVNPNAKATCGLVARRHVVVPSWYPSVPNSMKLTAAMLAQTGKIYGDYRIGTVKNRIDITGSMSYYEYGYFAVSSGGTVIGGFRNRTYSYDPRLEIFAPPSFPILRDGSLKVSTWIEE